jgi:hypothetical protein
MALTEFETAIIESETYLNLLKSEIKIREKNINSITMAMGNLHNPNLWLEQGYLQILVKVVKDLQTIFGVVPEDKDFYPDVPGFMAKSGMGDLNK